VGGIARLPIPWREIQATGPARSLCRRFFFCHASKLVVELDGRQHEWFAEYDAGRTEVFQRMGVRVVRFTNTEVTDDLDSVLTRIRAELNLPFS